LGGEATGANNLARLSGKEAVLTSSSEAFSSNLSAVSIPFGPEIISCSSCSGSFTFKRLASLGKQAILFPVNTPNCSFSLW
jgi:hypothetical protein